MSQRYFTTGLRQLHTSKQAMGELIGVVPAHLEGLLSLLTNATLHWERHEQQKLEHSLASGGVELISYLEYVRFDETPMLVGQESSLEHLVRQVPSAPSSQPAASSTAMSAPAGSLPLTGQLPRIATPSKLFAIDQKINMVIRAPAPDGDSSSSLLVVLQTASLHPLKLLEKANTDCQSRCLLESTMIGPLADSFRFKARIATTDQAPANHGAEKVVMQGRPPDWAHLQLPCNVHIVANTFTKTFKYVDGDVAGMINLALCLGQGGTMQVFRQCLVEEVQAKLVVLQGAPPAAVTERRLFLIDLFCSKGPNKELRRHLLRTYPNGIGLEKTE